MSRCRYFWKGGSSTILIALQVINFGAAPAGIFFGIEFDSFSFFVGCSLIAVCFFEAPLLLYISLQFGPFLFIISYRADLLRSFFGTVRQHVPAYFFSLVRA